MVTTIRAAQNTYTTAVTGGTRLAENVQSDIGPFMDAIERVDTPFLNGTKKGKPVNQHKHEWGIKSVNPRGSSVGVALTNIATTVTVLAGHGVRFQQGHVLRITHAADATYEHVWVSADPVADVLTIKRAQGGTVAAAAAVNDVIAIIGIALPAAADFPLAPVSRGRRFFNYQQQFSKSDTMTTQARKTPDYERPSGDWLDEDMLQLGADIKQDLEWALLMSYRQDGSPDPAATTPSMLGGMQQFAELSGNIFNIGGAAVLLTIGAIEDALVALDLAVGSRAGKRLLMSIHTKQIFNRMLNPVRSKSVDSVTNTTAKLLWNTVELETGSYEFTHSRNIPDGTIFVYNPADVTYRPYEGLDWHEKDVPTKGDYAWKGISGTFTFEAVGLPGMAIIRNFNTNISAYPAFGA